MVVLDAVHQIQAEQANDLACAGTARPASAAPARPRSTACRKLMCMTRLNELPTRRSRSPSSRCGPSRRSSDLVTDVSWNFEVKKKIKQFKPRAARRRRRHLAHAAGGHRPRAGVPQVHRVLPVPGRLPRPARPPQARRVHRPALPRLRRGAGDAPARRRGPRRRAASSSTASATATSPSAAPRSAPSTSPSPTTRSFRSRSAWSTGSTIRSSGCCASSRSDYSSFPRGRRDVIDLPPHRPV